jgi:hypothetical protein
MYNGKHHTAANMKKMNTERLHKLYQAVGFEAMFNPYESQARSFMIVLISVRLEEIFKQPAQDETSIYEGKLERHLTAMPVLSKLQEWWYKFGNQNAPEPTKGRISGFTYSQVKEMYMMDTDGFTYEKIAEYFQTSYMQVYQIVNGISYKWALVGF